MKEHSNRQRQRQGYKEAETGGEKRDREESKNTLAHTSPPLSKRKTMYKPRRPARTQGRMASSSSSSSLSLTLSLSLFLPSTSSATTNLWTADKSRPSLQKTAERRLGRKLTNRAAMHTQKCIVSKWCDAQLVNGRFLSLASNLCVCVVVGCRTLKRAKRMQANGK